MAALPENCEVSLERPPFLPTLATRKPFLAILFLSSVHSVWHDLIISQYYSLIEAASNKPEFFRATAAKNLPSGGFIIYDDAFLSLIGPAPQLDVILANDTYPFAHEAGVYMTATDEVWITSNQFKVGGKKRIQISKIKRGRAQKSQLHL